MALPHGIPGDSSGRRAAECDALGAYTAPMQEGRSSAQAAGSGEFSPSPAYANYVLGLLLLVAAFNLLDRQIFGMLIEPIK